MNTLWAGSSRIPVCGVTIPGVLQLHDQIQFQHSVLPSFGEYIQLSQCALRMEKDRYRFVITLLTGRPNGFYFWQSIFMKLWYTPRTILISFSEMTIWQFASALKCGMIPALAALIVSPINFCYFFFFQLLLCWFVKL